MQGIEIRHWPRELVFERGAVRRLGEFVDRLGASRALVICGRTVSAGEMLSRVREALGARCAGVFTGVAAHTPLPTVIEAAAQCRQCAADVIISVGGGSAIDTGKGVAVMIASGGEIEPYKLGQPGTAKKRGLPKSTLPHIAVPTVAASGSEVLSYAGVLDPQAHAKMRFQDELLLPRIAVMDPELAVFCGPGLTAATGLGALARCVECLYSKQRNRVSEALALHGLRLLVTSLPLGITHPHDLDARADCQYAGVMSAMATSNSEVSVVHAAGIVVGGRYAMPHGILHGMLLAPATRALLPALGERARLVYEALGGGSFLPSKSYANQAADLLAELTASLPVEHRLRAFGIARDELQALAEQTANHPMSAMAPRPVNAAEILNWLMAVW
jgi:alcohol dehydrogenase class IV